jgi:hypothetical protein
MKMPPAYMASIEASARNWALANRSDPFAYATARSHMQNQFAIPSDYSAEWRSEPRSIIRNGIEVYYSVSVPCNMRRV